MSGVSPHWSNMGFHYKKHNSSESSDSQWTSYSDLFMGLSVVFLLLYVTTSLRTGTNGLQQEIEKERLTQEVQDLRNQLKVYNTLKTDVVEKDMSAEDQAAYKNLLDKLDILKEEAKTEKDKLRQQALENENKEKALNQYQQMVRNMINSNMLAKSRIKKRDEIIQEKNEEIEIQSEEIADLEKTVEEKKQQIAIREQKIAQANANLQKKVLDLKWAFRNQRLSKAAYEKKMAQLQNENQSKVSELKSENIKASQQLMAANQELQQVQGKLGQVETQLTQTEQEKARLASNLDVTSKELGEQKKAVATVKGQLSNITGKLSDVEGQLSLAKGANSKLLSDLKGVEQKYGDQIGKLKGEFEAQRGRDRAAFEAAMAKEKLSGAERASREAAYRAEADRKQRELNDKLAGLGEKMKATEGQLAAAKAEIEARKQVANEIRKGFARVGVKADVNEETGEVLIDFGEHYFDTGRADIKGGMVDTLKKAFPVYAAALMDNPKVASKVSAVEIIGFASPTFKGKVIDPSSLNGQDREAVDYNLDLSYSRAKSIFQFLFDTGKMQYKHQKELLPMVKVTGRSFLAEGDKRKPSSGQEFCAVNDCKKAQRVIIRFSMEK